MSEQQVKPLRTRLREVLEQNQVTFRSRAVIYPRQAAAFQDSLLDQIEAAIIAHQLEREEAERE